MKTFWLKKEECTGCGACENVCPKKAIQLSENSCGFKYPIINENCIDCNLCESVCKRRTENQLQRFKQPEVYATWSLNKEIRYNSTSGGLFSEIAKIVLREKGYVAGAQYNNDNLVEHILVDNKEGLEKIRQSKYIQSDAKNIYTEIKTKLKQDKKVAFCGAPCQVAALYAYLGKEYENLLTIDFICRGMNSPKAYRAWLYEIEKEEKSKVKKVWFKYKVNGWKNSPRCTKVDFENGTCKVFEGDKNTFMSGYLGPNLYIRPSCGNCDFKGIQRQGDLTLADFWGIDKELDDDQGTSLVLVNSKKGKQFFTEISQCIFKQEMNIEDILDGNVCFQNSVEVNPKSKAFLESLDNMPFSVALKRYASVSVRKKILNRVKRVVKRIIN